MINYTKLLIASVFITVSPIIVAHDAIGKDRRMAIAGVISSWEKSYKCVAKNYFYVSDSGEVSESIVSDTDEFSLSLDREKLSLKSQALVFQHFIVQSPITVNIYDAKGAYLTGHGVNDRVEFWRSGKFHYWFTRFNYSTGSIDTVVFNAVCDQSVQSR